MTKAVPPGVSISRTAFQKSANRDRGMCEWRNPKTTRSAGCCGRQVNTSPTTRSTLAADSFAALSARTSGDVSTATTSPAIPARMPVNWPVPAPSSMARSIGPSRCRSATANAVMSANGSPSGRLVWSYSGALAR